MFYSPRLFLRDFWISVPLAGSLLLQGVIWWYILANITPSAEPVFLHYNIILGVDLVGEWWRLYFMPATGLLALFVNYGLSFFLYNNDKFLARLLALTVGIFHIFLAVAAILIVRINI